MEIAVGDGKKFPRLVQHHTKLCNGSRSQSAVGAEFGTAELNWQLAAIGHIIEGDPGDVMFDGVRVRNLLADGDLDVKRLPWHELTMHGYYRDVLLGLPVSRFDVISKAHYEALLSSCVILRLRSLSTF